MKKFTLTLLCAVATLFASAQNDTILNASFASGTDGFTTIDVALPGSSTYVWQSTSYGYMKASGYISGTNYACESWLVSPLFSLNDVTGTVTLSFDHAAKFQAGNVNEEFTVWIARNHSTTTITPTDWLPLTINTYPTAGGWTFSTANIDLSDLAGDDSLYIAFRYKSTATAADTWEIKNVAIVAEESGTTGTDEAFQYEPTTIVTKNVTFTDGEITNYGDELENNTNLFELLLESNEGFLDLYAFAPVNSGDTLPVGSYTINNSYAVNTAAASTGYDATYGYDVPTFYGIYTGDVDEEGYNIYDVTYYLVSGTLTASTTDTDYVLTLSATSYYGSTINGSYTCPLAAPNSVKNTFANTLNAYSNNGELMVEAQLGETINVYNVHGQLLASQVAAEGLNKFKVAANQLVIVRAADRVAKVLVK